MKGFFVSCDKDSKKYHKWLPLSKKEISTIANGFIYFNTSQYCAAVKACKKFALPINR